MKKIIELKTFIKFVLVLFAVGCTREPELPNPEVPLAPFTVKEARMWFETNLEPVLKAHTQAITKSGEAGMPSLIPFFDWSKAITGFNEDWSVVELPWEYKNGKVIYSLNRATANDPGLSADSLQLVRLVMAKNLNTHDVYAFRMVVLPDPLYLEHGGNLRENQYLQMQSNFRGLVLFYNVPGKFVVGYQYIEGKIAYKLADATGPRTKSGEVGTLKSSRLVGVYSCWIQRVYTHYRRLLSHELFCDFQHFDVISAGDRDGEGGSGGGFTGCPICGSICLCGGGGSGGGGDPMPVPPQIMPQAANPCEKIEALAASEAFRSKMAKLAGYTGKNFEAGYLLRNNHNGTFSYEFMRGPDGTLEIEFECDPMNQILGLIHTHPAHALPIFSAYDIRAVYLAFRANCIENLGFFPIGVVTPQSAYMLVVSDVQRFLAFGSRYLKYPEWFSVAQGIFAAIFDLYSDPEKAFLTFLHRFDAGLMLFEGNHADFRHWLNLKLDQAGNPVTNPYPC